MKCREISCGRILCSFCGRESEGGIREGEFYALARRVTPANSGYLKNLREKPAKPSQITKINDKHFVDISIPG
jgi:hypothetical protein